MFTGFNVKVEDWKEDRLNLKDYYEIGLKQFELYDRKVKEELTKYIYVDMQKLDGTRIQKEWFPQIKADVFLSHSHQDHILVISLAGWLKENFGITSFIDSCIWGYANDLLKCIDDEVSIKREDLINGNTYYYDKCIISSSHVHMMLSMDLLKMMDKTECLFFINTPYSINISNSIEERDKTLSAWIYAEIEMSNLIRKRSLLEYRKQKDPIFESSDKIIKNHLQIEYDVSLKHLVDLSDSDLLDWKYENKYKNALDYLYIDKGLLKENKIV